MQTTIDKMARWTLTLAILAGIAIIVSLTLEVGGAIHVHVHIFVTFAALAVTCGAGWVAVTCTGLIIRHFDGRISQRDKDVDDRMDAVMNNLAEVRLSLAEFAAIVSEYGDQRATAVRLDALQSMGEQSTPADADRGVTRLHRNVGP